MYHKAGQANMLITESYGREEGTWETQPIVLIGFLGEKSKRLIGISKTPIVYSLPVFWVDHMLGHTTHDTLNFTFSLF